MYIISLHCQPKTNFVLLRMEESSHFDTFRNGGVAANYLVGGGGISRIKTISAQLKLKILAELGKNCYRLNKNKLELS